MAARRTASVLVMLFLGLPGGVSVSLTASFAAQAESGSRSSVKLFILAGQSNLAGRAPASGLQARFRAASPRVQIDYVCSFGASDLLKPGDYPKDAGPPEPHRSGGWVALQPAPKHLSTPEAHFGPEMTFGHTLAAGWPGQRIALVKHGRGATSLAEDWDPQATSGRRLYSEMLAQVRGAIARLEAEGAAIELCAFVWCQGEADTTRREWADAYAANLGSFFARLRGDLSAPQLPVLFSLTGDGRSNAKMSFAPIVRQAQQQVASRDPHAVLVSGDDLPLLDHVHYDATGQMKLGERLASAYLQRTSQH
jgi:hypothetical protein